jgi:hypothetical protein
MRERAVVSPPTPASSADGPQDASGAPSVSGRGASGAALFVFPGSEIGSDVFFMTELGPTPLAIKTYPIVAERMKGRVLENAGQGAVEQHNAREKRSGAEVRKLKRESEIDMVIMGSGSVVSLLAQEGLIDEYQIAVYLGVLAKGEDAVRQRQRRAALEAVKDAHLPQRERLAML